MSGFKYLTPEQRLQKAASVARKALDAPFYAEAFRGHDPGAGIEAWQALPVLERQAMYDNAFPRSRAMLTEPLEGMIVSSTGGSSGMARYNLHTHEEWDVFCDMQARALTLLGVRPDDVVANLFVAGSLWPSFLGVHEVIKRAGAVHLPISANIEPEKVMELCAQFDPSVILSLPTMFVFMADIALREGLSFPNLRMIAYAGEQLSEQAERHVKKGLQVEEVKALAYTSADCGLMGYQCPHCGFGTYHLPTDFQFIEVVHPETGEPVPDGEKGEFLVTNLARQSMPVIRYQIGDLGTFLTEPCPCGDPNPLFVLAGRSGEDFKLGGAYISMRVFDDMLERFEDVVSPNYQVELEDAANQMDFRLHVEAGRPEAAEARRGEMFDALTEAVPEIKVGMELSYFRTVEIVFHELGSLPRSEITGKVKRLLDRRVVAENS